MGKGVKRLVIFLVALVVLVIAGAIIIPIVYEDEIETLVQEQVNEQLNAKVSWSDLDLSLISSFPSLTLELNDVVVTNNAPFEGVKLAQIGQVSLSLGLLSVLTDKISIQEIGMEKPIIDVRVREDGTANYDISKSESTEVVVAEESESATGIDIQNYWINNGELLYADDGLDMVMKFEGLNHEGKGNLGEDLFVLSTRTAIERVLFHYEGVDYLKDSRADLKADLDMDMANMKFTFKDNELVLDKLPLRFDGWLAMQENGYDMDLFWAATKTDLEGILSLVPAAFAKDLEGVEMTGTSQFDGFVKGHYDEHTMPGFALNAKVQNGKFKYPDLPGACEDIQLSAAINNPQGKDLNGMVVNIDQFAMKLAGQPLDAKLILKNPITDPFIDAGLKTNLDLGKIGEVIPMEENDRLQGLVNADVVLKGALSAIETEQYDKFHASGNALLKDMEYVSRTTGFPVNIDEMSLRLDPAFVDMPKFAGKFGGSDLSASGRVDNYLGWYLKEEGLKGRFNVHSNTFDMDELMASNNDESTELTADSVETGIFEVPKNFDVSISATANSVLYDGLELKNARGTMAIRDENIALHDVFFELFGGTANMAGDYNTQDKAHPFVDFDYDIKEMDIAETAKYMNTVQTLAPIAMSALGKFSTKMNLRTEIDENMEPILESMLGNGNLVTHSVTLDKFKPITKMATTLKLDNLKNPKLSNTQMSFRLEDGRMTTKPFSVRIDNIDAEVSGSTGLDQSIAYDIKTKIPADLLGGNLNGFVDNILGQANQTLGSSFSAGDLIDVDIKMLGTIDEPIIKPSIAGGTQSIKDAVVNQVTETVTEQVEDLSAQAMTEAQKQADALMVEANKQADEVRKAANAAAQKVTDEGYTAADKLVADAQNPIAKKLAKVAADKLRNETDKKAQKIRDEGNRKADGIVSTAQSKSDNLLEEARNNAP